MSNKFRKEKDCLNCGKEVESKYCSYCGQANTTHPETLIGFLRHFIEDLTHFDTGIFVSIRKLLFSPGQLTNVFNSGQRKKYLHPIRLYIFTSILVFAFFNYLSHDSNELTESDKVGNERIRDSLKQVGAFKEGNIFFHSDNGGKVRLIMDDPDTVIARNKINDTDDLMDQFGKTIAVSVATAYKKNPNDYLSSLWDNYLTNLPKSLLFLMPIFSILLALIYFRRRLYFMNHLVFSLHFHITILLIAVCIILCNFLPNDTLTADIGFGLIIFSAYHLFASLRRVYHGSFGRTTLMFVLLGLTYLLIIIIVNLLLLIYAAAQ